MQRRQVVVVCSVAVQRIHNESRKQLEKNAKFEMPATEERGGDCSGPLQSQCLYHIDSTICS
jgi:hypothetical protein